jgi:ribosomal protein S18 acetylase RimI-like enzyme
MPTVRAMTMADYPAAVALWRSTEGVGFNESDEERFIAAYLERNPGMSPIAVADDGALIGTLLCGHDGRRGYLYHLAVVPAHRRQGIAGALLEHAFAGLERAGVLKCYLFVFADNLAGQEFWKRRGWDHRADLVAMQKPVR